MYLLQRAIILPREKSPGIIPEIEYSLCSGGESRSEQGGRKQGGRDRQSSGAIIPREDFLASGATASSFLLS